MEYNDKGESLNARAKLRCNEIINECSFKSGLTCVIPF